VWDVDSPHLARFDDEDAKGMAELCRVFIEFGWKPTAR
jgi:L-methionine (R)-S-oxide reductase